ncbi:MAG: ribonuclease HI [Nitrososphaeraceae archaeon]
MKTIQKIRLMKSFHPSPEKTIQVYFDGLCQPCNPGGTACFAFIVKNEEGNTIHSEYGLAEQNSTNNVAEYTGIIRALEWLIANNYQNETTDIKGDSQLVIQQIKRNFKVNATNIIPLYRYAMSLISRFKHIQFELIPRDQNKEADRLSNLAYQELRLGV